MPDATTRPLLGWFASDRAGRIAAFAAGGPLPRATRLRDLAAAAETMEPPRDEGGRVEAECATFELATRIHPECTAHHIRAVDVRGPQGPAYLFFVDSLEPLAERLATGHAIEVPAREGRAVLVRQLSAAARDQLHAALACRGCFLEGDADQFSRVWLRLADAGIYRYNPLAYEDDVSPVYGRVLEPAEPVTAEVLSDSVRSLLQPLALDVDFTTDGFIQPADLMACDLEEEDVGYYSLRERHLVPQNPELPEMMAPVGNQASRMLLVLAAVVIACVLVAVIATR